MGFEFGESFKYLMEPGGLYDYSTHFLNRSDYSSGSRTDSYRLFFLSEGKRDTGIACGHTLQRLTFPITFC